MNKTKAMLGRGAIAIAMSLASLSPAFALDAGATFDASAPDDAGAEARATSPEVAALMQETEQVRELASGTLTPNVAPASLFEIPIDDDRAVALEAARLRALVNGLDAGAPSGKSPKGVSAHQAKTADAAVELVEPVPADLWKARVDLDRARLAFYELSPSARRDILAAHAKSQSATDLSESEQRAADSEAQRQLALKAAREARTEAERLVATEEARLLEVERAQALFEGTLAKTRDEISSRREVTLGWQRRAHDAAAGTPEDADRTYDDLRRTLRSARDLLSVALDDLSSDTSAVPQAGPDPLANLQIDIDVTTAREERARVVSEGKRLDGEERTIRAERASQLLDEIDTLNRERLGLLVSLSPEKRAAITGFTAAGLDQAASELRQLTLILRYHRHVIADLVVSLRHPSRSLIGRTLAGSAVTLIQWLVVITCFFWWRRRSPALLTLWRKRALESDRHERLTAPSVASRVLGFVLQVHRPVEWLVLLLVLISFLPAELQSIMEVRLFTTVVTWTFGAAFIVNAVNAVAGGDRDSTSESDAAKLRLRSLRFVGGVVVVFGLVLVISSMLVGHGTIYQWVFSTCWLASIPVLLVLVQWWKKVVFRRLDLVRKKSTFQKWVLAHSTGWASFVAATAGGAHLFVTGTLRFVRTRVGRFDLYRRALAYLFRREMDKLVADREPATSLHLPDDRFRELGPETPSRTWIDTEAEEALALLAQRVRERKGGVVAIVGARGMGKSATLAKLHADDAKTLLVEMPVAGLDALRALLAEKLGMSAEATLASIASTFAASDKPAIFVDDVHRLVQPVMGGLRAFDALLDAASRHSARTTWVFAVDSVIWQFLDRSRGARPLFDEVVHLKPWREAEVVELLASRTAQAAIAPSFEGLLERLPANADEIDKREALEKRASDYYRLLWDHAGGNPGIVLHVWRRSLGLDSQGTVCVRLFQTLDTADLERLPDHAVFVLRAILQLSPADASDITKATMVRPSEVIDALRYAVARGYIREEQGRYQITWTWLRAIRMFLQRRHLLGA